MGLRFIYGRSGSGKSKFCFDEIANKIEKNMKNVDDSKIYIVTPEQFSFTAEKKLMERISSKAVINAEVLTFNRMAYRVINEKGGRTKTNLSSCGKAMIIHSVIHKYKKNLVFLGKSNENIDLISRAITEFKKHKVTISDLKKEYENTKDIYLKIKLKDMILIYEEFSNRISDTYIDENDLLTILAEKIDDSKEFKNSYIYIDEFSGFTNQEYVLITKLLKMSKEVTVTICSDSLNVVDSPNKDIFYPNKITISRLMEIANENNIEINENIYLDKIERFKNRELAHIEKNIYDVKYNIYKDDVSDIEIFLANNPYSEIENIAESISNLVRNEGYKYNDVSVVTKNIDTYSSLIKAIFSKYDIPVFIDEKKDLSQNIIVKFILSIIEIFSKNWSYDAMFNYIKSGFLTLENDEIFKLQNYCIKWGIKGRKWYKEEWDYGINDENSKKEVQRYNELRKIIVDPLLNFKNKIDKSKKVEEITKALYEFLTENSIDKKLESKLEKLEKLGFVDVFKEYSTGFNILLNVFDEIVLVFGEEKIGFEKYFELLKVGLDNSELGKIPATLDQVVIGDIDRSRSHKIKAIYLIGLNDGIFPSVNKNEGFFDDNDRENLKVNGIELAKGTTEKIYEDNFNIYKAFTTAEERIFLSYVSSDTEGKSLRPSILISKVKKIFPNIKKKSDIIHSNRQILNNKVTFDELLKQLNNLNIGKDIDDIWIDVYNYYKNNEYWKYKLDKSIKAIDYTNIPEKINKKSINKLYGDILKTSISKLEQYKRCPFSFYLKYGLKISDRDSFRIEAVDTGSFMHEVIDVFFTKVREKNIEVKSIKEENLNDIVEEIVNEKLKLPKNYIFISTPKFRVLTKRLKRVIVKSLKYILESLKNTDFEITDNEVEFKKGNKYEPIVLELEDNKKVEITGKIDRIDLAKNADGKFVRIIDYKSSVKNLDLNEVIAGLQIQLITYLDAVCKIEDVMPAGVLYFSLIDPIIKSNKSMTNEEIEKEIKKRFKMQGLILADVNIVKMMDTSLEKGNSNIIPAYMDKDGNLSKSKSNIISNKQFESLQKYVKNTIKEMSKEIFDGNIELKPYYNTKNKKTPCEYCKYKPICNFNKGFCKNEYNYINNESKQEIFNKLENE